MAISKRLITKFKIGRKNRNLIQIARLMLKVFDNWGDMEWLLESRYSKSTN